jgi:hypothetical protein
VGFEPTISAGERPQTYALDRAATGTGTCMIIPRLILLFPVDTVSNRTHTVLLEFELPNFLDSRHCSGMSTASRQHLEATHFLRDRFRECLGQGLKVSLYLHLELRLRMRESVPPRPHTWSLPDV